MDQAAEEIASFDWAGRWSRRRIGRPETSSSMWALGVVVRDVLAEESAKVALASGQEPVEAFAADVADEAFRVGVRDWRLMCPSKADRSTFQVYEDQEAPTAGGTSA